MKLVDFINTKLLKMNKKQVMDRKYYFVIKWFGKQNFVSFLCIFRSKLNPSTSFKRAAIVFAIQQANVPPYILNIS